MIHSTGYRTPRPVSCRYNTPAALCLLLAAALPLSSLAETISIVPVRDNTLFKDPAGAKSSGAGPNIFAGNNSSMNTRRAVIAFDVAAFLPADATIDSVALVLHVSSAPNETPQSLTVHRLLAAWGEGTSVSQGGAGDTSTTDDATWLHTFYPDQFWDTPGGDFDDAPSASAIVPETGFAVWSSAAMAANVQDWLDDNESNFGWLIRGNEAGASTVRRFNSREHATVEFRPRLDIFYTPTTAPARSGSWGAIKKQYRGSDTRPAP